MGTTRTDALRKARLTMLSILKSPPNHIGTCAVVLADLRTFHNLSGDFAYVTHF